MNETTEIKIREIIDAMRVNESDFQKAIENDLLELAGEEVAVTDYVWDNKDDGSNGPAFIIGLLVSLTLESFDKKRPVLHVCAVQMPHAKPLDAGDAKQLVKDWNDRYHEELSELAYYAGGELPCQFGFMLNNDDGFKEDDPDD